jgi:uncharacterized protein YhaN
MADGSMAMKITAFHIDGFGIFHDFGVKELGDGLTVFYGPNEAGKSTLLDFIRYTLFGYPSRRTRTANQHEPLRGGTHGGRIEIILEDGRTSTVKGVPGQPPNLEFFQGITREIFEGYFAFDLDELRVERFKNRAESIQTILHDAAQTGRMRSPATVSAELAENMAEIYKPRGQTQPLKTELSRLAELCRQIKDCQQRPREYEEKRRTLEELDKRIQETRDSENHLSKSLDQAKRLVEIQPLFRSWREASAVLGQMDKIEDFPANALVRLEELDERMSELAGKIEEKRSEIVALKGRQSARPVDARWLERAPAIQGFLRERSKYEERTDRLRRSEKDFETLAHDINGSLARLGEGWTAEKVRGVASDLLAEDRVRQPLERIRRAEQNLANERKESDVERRRLESLGGRLVDQEKVAVSNPPWLALAMGAFLMLALAIGAFALGQVTGGVVLLIAALCVGTVLVWLWATSKGKQAEERGAVRQIEQQLEEARQTVETRRRQIETLEAGLERGRTDLRSALESVGLPPTLSADVALEAFDQIREMQKSLGKSDRLESEIVSERQALGEYAEQVFALGRELAMEIRGEWPALLDRMERRLQEEQDADEKKRSTDSEIAIIEHELAQHTEDRRRCQEKRDSLLTEGGAANDSELFRRRFEKARTYTQAVAQLNTARAKLDAHCPPGELPERFLGQLEKTDWSAVEAEFGSLKSRLQETQAAREQMQDDRTRLDQEIKNIEQEERLFDLRQQEEATRARLAELAHQWNVFAVAEELMRRIQADYDSKRQPKRILRASELFRRFTRGQFERVKSDDEGKNYIAVRSKNLEELRPEALSRGTCEQLYLAMRLAPVEELAGQGIVLPLIFDDILVNFDDLRARATAETLAEVARDRQVWFFTAHEPTLALLREIGIAREVGLDAPFPS